MRERFSAIRHEVNELRELYPLKEYRPEFFAEGADQLVFSFPEHPQIVAKIKKFWIEYAVLHPEICNKPFSELPSDFQEMIFSRLKNDRRQFTLLKQYFTDMVLHERFVFTRLPISKNLIKILFPKNTATASDFFVDLPVRIQERKGLKKGGFLSLTHGYFELPSQGALSSFLTMSSS